MLANDFLTVGAASAQVTSGAASAEVAIPNAADGNKARFVRITSKGNAYIRPVQTGTTVAASNGILIIAAESIYLNVQAFTHIAYIQETSASIIQITPIEVG
jgi:hypothetical protein